MQIRGVKKKSHIFLYFSVMMIAFAITYHTSSSANDVSITFSAKTAESGWIIEKSSKTDPSSAFASESSLLNALKITIEGGLDGGIKYTFHQTDGDWLKWAKDGQESNSDSTATFNAVKVKLYGDVSKRFNILYRIKTKDGNWSKWYKNGAVAGNTSSKDAIAGLQVTVENTSPLASIEKVLKGGNSSLSKPSSNNVTSDFKPITVMPSKIVGLDKLKKPIKGIDVSYYNGVIDWKKVKAAGIDYAIIQVGYRGCTEGALKNDNKFEYNMKGAIENDIKVGVYFVTQALNVKEAKEEAEFVLKRISNYSIDYPVYIDIEDVKNARQLKLNTKQRTAVCKTFCKTIYEAGYETGIYACQYYYESKLNTKELLDYNIWMAAYEQKSKPSTNFEYQMWQCSETGKVSGISTNVDVNYVYYDYLNYTRTENVATSEPTMEPASSASPSPSDNADTGTTSTDTNADKTSSTNTN